MDRKESAINIVVGTGMDFIFEGVSNKTIEKLDTKFPSQRADCSKQLREKVPGYTSKQVQTRVRKVVHRNRRLASTVEFAIGSVCSSLPY